MVAFLRVVLLFYLDSVRTTYDLATNGGLLTLNLEQAALQPLAHFFKRNLSKYFFKEEISHSLVVQADVVVVGVLGELQSLKL